MLVELLILLGIKTVAKDVKNCTEALIEELEEEFEDEYGEFEEDKF